MKKYFVATAIGAIISSFAVAAAANELANFDGGIGVNPAALNNGAFVLNDVFGVPPGGRPWVIKTLEANVKIDGHISPCVNPTLLIRNAAGETPGAWFAAGMPK